MAADQLVAAVMGWSVACTARGGGVQSHCKSAERSCWHARQRERAGTQAPVGDDVRGERSAAVRGVSLFACGPGSGRPQLASGISKFCKDLLRPRACDGPSCIMGVEVQGCRNSPLPRKAPHYR